LVDDPAHSAARVLQVKAAALAAAGAVEEFKSRLAAGEVPTEREFERLMRDALGLTRSQAEVVAGLGWKTLRAREGGSEAKSLPAEPIADLSALLAGFSLPSL